MRHLIAGLLASLLVGLAPSAEARLPSAAESDLVRAELVSLVPGPEGMIVAMVLRPEDRDELVAIFIGPIEADAIQRVRRGIVPDRPLTHELMATLLDNTGARLERLVIDEARDGAYLATLQLRLRDRGDPVWVDTRPSDGMTLALRAKAPVFLSRQVIEAALSDQAGEPGEVRTGMPL